MDRTRKWIWRLLCTLAIGLTLLALSPVVIPEGRYQPELAGIPYTLWMGFLVSVLLVIVTYAGILFHPGKDS